MTFQGRFCVICGELYDSRKTVRHYREAHQVECGRDGPPFEELVEMQRRELIHARYAATIEKLRRFEKGPI